jgi:DNA repair protein RadC
MAQVATLKGRLQAGDRLLTAPELVCGLLDPDVPDTMLGVAHQVVDAGLRLWSSAAADDRALGLGLTRRQALRLRLACALVAGIEEEGWAMPAPITAPSDVLGHVGDIRACRQEKVVAIYLDARNRPLHREVVAIGGLRSSIIQPRDVLAPAINLPAAGVILAHNHPSGDVRPSPDDLDVTRQLAAAARLFGIELLDHLVVSQTGYCSIKELGGL